MEHMWVEDPETGEYSCMECGSNVKSVEEGADIPDCVELQLWASMIGMSLADLIADYDSPEEAWDSLRETFRLLNT